MAQCGFCLPLNDGVVCLALLHRVWTKMLCKDITRRKYQRPGGEKHKDCLWLSIFSYIFERFTKHLCIQGCNIELVTAPYPTIWFVY